MSPETEELGQRIRDLIGHKPGVVEKRMFGGFGFMLYGNMVAGAMSTGELLLRADPARMGDALAITGAAPMKMGERLMTGFYTVDLDAIANDDDLKVWIDRSWAYVKTLPPKDAKPAVKMASKAAAKAGRKTAKTPAAKSAARKAAVPRRKR